MYGFDPTTFSDSYNPTPTLGQDNRVRAKQKAGQILTDGRLGSKITLMKGQNVGDKYLRDAQGSAQSTLNRAGGVMAGLDFLGGMGSIGASPGGFGNFGGGGGFNVADAEVMGMPSGQANYIGSGGTTEWTTDMANNAWKPIP